MPVIRDDAWSAFDEAMETIDEAVRLKQIRDQPIVHGRGELSLFERAPAGGRPHPRLRTAFTEPTDPFPPSLPGPEPWADASAFRSWLEAALADEGMTAGLDNPPAESPRYWQNALRAGRITAVLDHAREAIDLVDYWSESQRDAARYVLAEVGEQAYAGDVEFDDEDTGTYHSFLHDQPFVHVLERLRETLPREGTPAFDLLPAEQQHAVRRQHEQLTNHLDFLMRHKYALYGITETDIERTLGGFLIDRETRQVASEDPATRDSLRPRHQLLRIDPASTHAHAGAWVMRTAGGFVLRDGTSVEVTEEQLRTVAVPQEQLSFERAPDDPRLRAGVRFDWDGDGWVDEKPIEWVLWGGHCDVKAVLEAIGLTMLHQPTLYEYRSDTGKVITLSRKLLLELLAGVFELGSVYDRMDGTGVVVRGIRHFGGARNDSLPDRLQFRGFGEGRHFRWPVSTERDAMQVIGIREGGEDLDVDAAFVRWIADTDALEFSPNPRYLRTVDGDYNLIDATGMVLTALAEVASFDDDGQLVRDTREIEIDLRPEAEGRTFLGTHLHDAGARELYRVYLDRAQPAMVAELWRWDADEGDVHESERDIVVPLVSPLSTTLSREMRRDDPEMFRALIDLALHRGQNICADTDEEAPVWNGVVTSMQVERMAVNRSGRVERWRAYFEARFGTAELGYMVRRAPDGTPEAYCPVEDPIRNPPDFLWQDLPDIASKGVEEGAWVVNRAMRERGIVRVRWAPHEEGGWYVEDDHVKNAFELLYAALGGYRYTIVHQNKRYVFEEKAAWQAARERLDELRDELSFD
jgi:hypothetical protein